MFAELQPDGFRICRVESERGSREATETGKSRDRLEKFGIKRVDNG